MSNNAMLAIDLMLNPENFLTLEGDVPEVSRYFAFGAPSVTFTKASGKYSVPGIKNFVCNGNTCVIVWEDGERTLARCGEGETFDRYTGFMACVCKRLFGGTTTAKKLMNQKDADYQRVLRETEAQKAKEKAEAEAAEKARVVAARKAKAREKAIRAMAELIVMEKEAQREAEKLLGEKESPAEE